jgi:SAM-dependent methyltransferase
MTQLETEELSECAVCGSQYLSVLDRDAAISICRRCGYAFDNPRPTLAEIIKFYSAPSKYDGWLSQEEAREKLWTRRLVKFRRIAPPGALLDVGAGIGQFLQLARRDYPEISGTEVSSSAVAIALKRYGLHLLPGTLEEVPLKPESFDNITAFHVLEHVPNPRSFSERCFALLRENGILVLAVPNEFRPFKSGLRWALGRIGIQKYQGITRTGLRRIRLDGSMDEIHLSHFTPRSLKYLLDSCGFQVIQNDLDRYYVPAGGVKNLIHDARYFFAKICHILTDVNVYDTIWMVAQKPGANGRNAQTSKRSLGHASA